MRISGIAKMGVSAGRLDGGVDSHCSLLGMHPTAHRRGRAPTCFCCGSRYSVPILACGNRPHFRAALAAGGGGESRLDVGEPHMIRPAVGADLDVVPTAVVAAIDQHIADAGGAHVAECDFGLIGQRHIPALKL